MKIFTSSILAGAMTLAAFGQSACTKSESTDKADRANAREGEARRKGPLTLAEAEQKVLKKYPDSYLISAEAEMKEGSLFYEIEAKTAARVYEVTIDAAGGKFEIDDHTQKFRADSLAGKAPLWPVDLAERDAAKEAALKAYPGETQQWKAVADSGRAAFNFRIKSETGETKKVVVKAGTNEILKIKY